MVDKILSFVDLKAWQKSKTIAVEAYSLTRSFPSNEAYGLTSQIRRCSVSIAANIAEGFSRNSAKDKTYFYSIALGSLTELLSHLYIAGELELISIEKISLIESEVILAQKMINGLIKSAQDRPLNT